MFTSVSNLDATIIAETVEFTGTLSSQSLWDKFQLSWPEEVKNILVGNWPATCSLPLLWMLNPSWKDPSRWIKGEVNHLCVRES